MIALDPEKAAPRIARWFRDLRETLDETEFAAGGDEVHRRAAALTSVTRHAALFEDAVRRRRKGQLLPVQLREAILVLAGASHVLGLPAPDESQWLAAARNVITLDVQLADGRASPWVAGDVASVFREHFLEALRHAGVMRVPTILDAANRRTALGLAVNWGMRYVVAAAAALAGTTVTDPAVQEVVAAVSAP